MNSLKDLTEEIVKKQHDSLQSIDSLCKRTDAINSDISNLINSLQMVGNRQFAENKVQDETSADCRQILLSSSSKQHQPDRTTQDISTVGELKLSSILLKAIRLIPNNLIEKPKTCLDVDDVELDIDGSEIEPEVSSGRRIEAEIENPPVMPQLVSGEPEPKLQAQPADLSISEMETKRPKERDPISPVKGFDLEELKRRQEQRRESIEHVVSKVPQTIGQQQAGSSGEQVPKQPTIIRKPTKDRVTDILKRYSLYDENDVDEDEDEESD